MMIYNATDRAIYYVILSLLICLLTYSGVLSAATEQEKIVVHVADNDPRTLQGAVNAVAALLDEYGKDGVTIEVVANGLGISLVNALNKYQQPVVDMMQQGVKVTACNATINSFLKRKEKVNLIEGVKIVPYGVVRVHQLQKQGYLYIRP